MSLKLAQEKAKELIYQYYDTGCSMKKAKEYALIAVREIKSHFIVFDTFWENVEQEIINYK